MAAGSADHNVRVYAMLGDEGPRRVLEVEAHSDTVDSIQWAHNGLRFISGSKDGTANVWHFEQQQWLHKQLLMTTKLPGYVASIFMLYLYKYFIKFLIRVAEIQTIEKFPFLFLITGSRKVMMTQIRKRK